MMRKLLSAFALLLLVGGAGAGTGWWLYTRPGPLEAYHAVVVPKGQNQTVARGLVSAGVIRNFTPDLWTFRLAAYLTRKEGPLHAEELDFPAHVSLREALDILRHAPPVQHWLTIPEGWTAQRMMALLLSVDSLEGPVPAFDEGDLLPQTLSFVRDTPRGAVVNRLRRLMRRTLDDVWAHRDPALGLADERSLLILASIVERETGIPAERPQIARVFLNRLAHGMKLQSDPTVIYDLSEGRGELERPLTHADLQEAGPSNTYVIAGLPPQPICSPGRAALEAVAHPAEGNALYFVATGKGGHFFSDTLDEHNRKVGLYRAARRGGATQEMPHAPER